MIKINSHSKRSRVTCIKETPFKIYVLGGGAARVQRRLVYIYLLNVPSVSSRYFNKIKRTSLLGKHPALSLEILVKYLYVYREINYCLNRLLFNISIDANSVDPDQTAPVGAVLSGCTLFVYEA